MYLELTLPISVGRWTNRIGFNIIKKVELYIGSQLIDRMYGLWMYIWTELTHTIDKKNLLDTMVGTTANNGVNNGLTANTPRTLTIPLLFSFCRHHGAALPLLALYNQDNPITLKFQFNTLNNCLQLPANNIGSFTNVKLWVDYIYLEKSEKTMIIQNPLDYLIESVQQLERSVVPGGVRTIPLPFNLPSKELMWVVSNNINDKFTNFTSNLTTSMVSKVQFKFNSNDVFSSGFKTNDYFNLIVPFQYHNGSPPNLGINCYSFSLYPEKLEPSGIINFKNLTSSMNIEVLGTGTLNLYSFSYNILKFENGDATLVYKN